MAIDIIPAEDTAFINPESAHTLGTRNATEARFNAHFPEPRRKLFLPAAFRHGSCVVRVEGRTGPRGGPPSREFHAADFPYFKVFPDPRRLAGLIMAKCGGFPGRVSASKGPYDNRRDGKLTSEVPVRTAPAAVGGRWDEILGLSCETDLQC